MIRNCAPTGSQAPLVPQPPHRHSRRCRRSRARRRQRRQAALAGRRAARSLRRGRTRRSALWTRCRPDQPAAVRRRRRRHAVRRRCVRLRRVLARARARPGSGGGYRRDHSRRKGRLHRGPASGAAPRSSTSRATCGGAGSTAQTLVFTAKRSRAFDPEIAGYIERSGVERELERLLDRAFDYRIVCLRWEENVDVRVEGSPDPLFVATALSAEVHHRPGQTFGQPDAHRRDGAPPSATSPPRAGAVRRHRQAGVAHGDWRAPAEASLLPGEQRVVGVPEAWPALADHLGDVHARSRRPRCRGRRTPSPTGGRGGCATPPRGGRRHPRDGLDTEAVGGFADERPGAGQLARPGRRGGRSPWRG